MRPYRSSIALLETDALRWTRSCVPIFRYSSRCTTTDAQTERPYRSRIALLEIGTLWLDTIVRPYRNRIALLETGTLWLDMSRASVQRATRFIGLVVRFAELRSQCWLAHLKKKKLPLRQAAQ